MLGEPVECDDGDVQPVEDDAQQRQHGGDTDDLDALLPDRAIEEIPRQDHTAQHLDQEPDAPAREQEVPLLAVNHHEHLEEKIDEHGADADPPQSHQYLVVRGVLFVVEPRLENPVTDRSFEDDHGKTGEDTGNEKEHGDEFREPQRVNLALCHQEQRSKARLMQCRQGDTEDHGGDGQAAGDLANPLHAQPFGYRGRELDELRGHVQHEVPGNQEEHRAHTEVVADDRIDDVPGSAQIQHQGARVEEIGQESVQNRCPDDRVILLCIQDIDEEGHDIGAAGKGDAGNHVESDPDAPGCALVEVRDRADSLREAIDESGTAKRIVAIGNCAQYFSSVPVDEKGNAVHNAIMWEDSRASKHISKLMGGFPTIMGYNIFKLLRWLYSVGIPPILMGIGATSHMLLLKNELTDVWNKTYKVLEPADFISMKLTGKFQTSENTGFAYTMIKKAPWSKGTYNKSLVKFLGLDINRYPEILPVGENLGSPKKEVVEQLGLSENVSVFSGMQDTTACMLGGGAFDNLDTVIEIGTTLNTGVAVDKRIIDILNGIFSVSSPVPNKYILVGEPGAGAKSLNYLLNNLLRVDDSLSRINSDTEEHHAKIADNMAAKSPIGSNGVVFLPWIFGSTFPEPDTNMRGGFINLSPENTRDDMIRAIFESYAMNFKWVLETKGKNLNGKIKKVNFTGGGAMWETAPQILADALQIPVHLMDQPRQANTKGIAFMCFNNLGVVTYDEMKTKLKVSKVFHPQKENFAFYDNQLKIFKRLFNKMRPIYASLNE